MRHDREALYAQRLSRYVTARRNGQPDCVPVRPFAAEVTAKYAGFTCQQVTHNCPVAYRNNLSLVRGGMAMLDYFHAFGPQIDRMRSECGTPSAICGMLKAPLDILGNKLRGYLALAFDLMEIPEKVREACEALMPHLGYLALTGADPQGQIPTPIWMHRGCTPFIPKRHFRSICRPTLKPIIEALGARESDASLRGREVGQRAAGFRRASRRQHHLPHRPH
jgi:hypothetical protein